MVLLHGQPGSSRDWSAVAPLLVATCCVVAVDRLGYGRSPGPAGDFPANARAVAATLDGLGVERAVVVGHSWAGGVALTLATEHPGRVAGLVLVSSVGPGADPGRLDRLLGAPVVGDAVVASTFRVARAMLVRPAIRAGLGRVLPASGRATLDVVAGGTRADRGLAIGPNPWRSFLTEQRVFNRTAGPGGLGAPAGRLASITVPTTVLTGDSDRIVDPAVSAGLAAAIPGAELETIPGAGHLLPFDHPGELAEAVRRVAVSSSPGSRPAPSPPPGCAPS